MGKTERPSIVFVSTHQDLILKGRVVTKGDYESAKNFSNPNIKSVTAWGGEDNVPLIYGKIFYPLNAVIRKRTNRQRYYWKVRY